LGTSFLRKRRLVIHIVTTQAWHSARQDDQLLKNVLVRFTATIGSAGITTLSPVAEEVVVEELERRVFCRTSMSLAAAEASKLSRVVSGIVSGATVEADQVACSQGRRGRKRWVGWVDIVDWGVWTGWDGWMSGDWALLLIVAHRLIRRLAE
jgi:hypothetical protein